MLLLASIWHWATIIEIINVQSTLMFGQMETATTAEKEEEVETLSRTMATNNKSRTTTMLQLAQ